MRQFLAEANSGNEVFEEVKRDFDTKNVKVALDNAMT